MVSSTLNPEAINKISPASFESFGNFMLGENYNQSLDITDATNKIVNFNRAKVSPITPDINSLISNISKNILNQFNTSIKNTTNFLKDDIDKRILQLSKDLYSKILELQSNLNDLQKNTKDVSSDIQKQIISQIQIQTQEINQLKLQINELKTETKSQVQNEVKSFEKEIEINQLRTEVQSQVESEVIRINTELNSLKTETQSQIESEIIRFNNELNSLKAETQSQIQIENSKLIQQQIQTELSPILQNQNLITNIQSSNQVQPGIPSLIQNQTSVTNLNSVVENIQNQVENVLDTTIRNFSKDYQDKIKGFDDVRPNNVLSKFLDLYRTSIGFINFFGDNKNTKTIEKNLKALRKIFTDSFEVAAILRQTIIKIVKQLSNLPTASASSGGLNLDIDVPGGRLRQAGGSRIRNIARVGGIAGAGLLGLGGAAAAMTGMGRAREYQESLLSGGVSAASGEPYIPENIVESFSGIVDRFTSAVNELINGAKRSAGAPGGGGRGGGAPGAAPGAPTTGPSSYSPGKIPGEVAKDKEFTTGVTELAKKYNVPEDYLYAVMGFETGGTFSPSIRNQAGSGATGLIQFMPETARGLGTTTDQLAGMTRAQQLKYVDKYFSGTLNKGASLSDVYMSVLMPAAVGKPENTVLFGPGGIIPSAYSQNKGLDLNGDGKVTKAEATSKVIEYLPKGLDISSLSPQTQTTPRQQPQQTPRVTPAPAPAQTIQARAQTISQPAQQVPQTISLPPTVIDATGGQSQPSQSASVPTVPSAPPSPGPEVPFLPTTNPDNFLTMYSRIVYNIVDG